MTKKKYPYDYRMGLRLPRQEYIELLNMKLKLSRKEGRRVSADKIIRDALQLYYASKKKPKVPEVKDRDTDIGTTIYLKPEERIHLMNERTKRVNKEGHNITQKQILREALALYHDKSRKKPSER